VIGIGVIDDLSGLAKAITYTIRVVSRLYFKTVSVPEICVFNASLKSRICLTLINCHPNRFLNVRSCHITPAGRAWRLVCSFWLSVGIERAANRPESDGKVYQWFYFSGLLFYISARLFYLKANLFLFQGQLFYFPARLFFFPASLFLFIGRMFFFPGRLPLFPDRLFFNQDRLFFFHGPLLPFQAKNRE